MSRLRNSSGVWADTEIMSLFTISITSMSSASYSLCLATESSTPFGLQGGREGGREVGREGGREGGRERGGGEGGRAYASNVSLYTYSRAAALPHM